VSMIDFFDRVTLSHVCHFVKFKLNIYYLLNTSVVSMSSYEKCIAKVASPVH
jgi:hypothetical protein